MDLFIRLYLLAISYESMNSDDFQALTVIQKKIYQLKLLKQMFMKTHRKRNNYLNDLWTIDKNESITKYRYEGILKMEETWPYSLYEIKTKNRVSKSKNNFRLVLDIQKESDVEMLKIATRLRLYKSKVVNIHGYRNDNYDLLNFFDQRFPSKVEYLHLNLCACDTPKMSFYMPSLEKCFQRVTKEIYIFYSLFDTESFEGAIKNSSKIEYLVFNECTINISRTLCFEGPDYKTKCISFENMGPLYGKNINFMDIFSEFVSAICKCGLNQSLTRLNTQRCEILDSVELDLLAQYRLTKINLTHDRIFQLENKNK